MVLFVVSMGSALALTGKQNGPSIDLAAGLGLGSDRLAEASTGAPLAARAGGHLSLGWWAGTYDDQFSFGKYWAFCASTRFDIGHHWSLAPMFEIQRGLELIVVGVHPFIAGGPLVLSIPEGELRNGAIAVGWTARAGVGGKFRRHRFWGLTLRLEGGVDSLQGRLGPAGGVLLGAAFARPARAITDPEL